MKDKKETKLEIFAKAVEDFGNSINQEREKVKIAKEKLKEPLITDKIGGGSPVNGYSLKDRSDPHLFIKAAYNLQVITARLIVNINNVNLLELKRNKAEMGAVLLEALEVMAFCSGAIEKDRTAQVAKICRQLLDQSNQLIEKQLQKRPQLSSSIPKILKDLAKKLLGEGIIAVIDEVTPPTAQVLRALFDITERRCRIRVLSNEIETLLITSKDQNLSSNRLSEMRQELIKLLPDELQKGFSTGDFFDQEFLTQYQQKWQEYLKELGKMNVEPLTNTELSGTGAAFIQRIEAFRKEVDNLLPMVSALSDRFAPPQTLAPEIIAPPEPAGGAVPLTMEKIDSLSTESLQTIENTSSTEITETKITPDELKPTQNIQEPETQEPINEVDVEVDKSLEADKSNPDNVFKEEALQPLIEKIKEITQKKEKLDNTFNSLSKTIVGLEAKIKVNQENLITLTEEAKNLEKKVVNESTITALEQERDSLMRQCNSEVIIADIQADKDENQKQLDSLQKLREEIDEGELTFADTVSNDQVKLKLLNIDQAKMESYLALQEENHLLNRAVNFVVGLFIDTSSKSTAEQYQQQKNKFLAALDEKSIELTNKKIKLESETEYEERRVALETKLVQVEEKISLAKTDANRFKALNIQISGLEEQIASAKKGFDETKIEQAEIEQQRNTLGGKISNLTNTYEKLAQEIQQACETAEAAKRIEEEAAAKLKAEQEGKEKILEAQNLDTTVDAQIAEKPAEPEIKTVSSEDLSSRNKVAGVKPTEGLASVPKSIEDAEAEMLAKRGKLDTAKHEFLSCLPWHKSYQEKVKKGEDFSGRPRIDQALSAYIIAWFDYKAAWKEFANTFKASHKDSWEAYKNKWETYRTEYKASKKEFTDSTASMEEGKSQDNSATTTYPPIPRAISFFSSLPTQKEAPTSELDQKAGNTPSSTIS